MACQRWKNDRDGKKRHQPNRTNATKYYRTDYSFGRTRVCRALGDFPRRVCMAKDYPMMFSFTFEVRQNKMRSQSNLQRERHFCFDANPYAIGRWGLRRNRNVCAPASSDLSHFELESTMPNKSPEPTAGDAFSSAVAVHVASRRWLSFLS